MTERDFFFSLVPSGGEILFVFFLSSRRRVLSLSMSKTKERVKEMRERATGTTPSSVRALLFFVFLERRES